MLQNQATPPHDIAVSLYEQGKPTGEIGAALVSSGMEQAAAEAYVSGLSLAVIQLHEGKSAAEVWSALVTSGMAQAEAQTLVKELLTLRERQLEEQRREEEHIGSGFCKTCYAESSWEAPGNIGTANGMGRKFLGGARDCKTCGAAVSILWFVVFFFPVITLGSYRQRYVDDTTLIDVRRNFIARRTRTRWQQVVTHYAVALAVCAAFVVVAMLADRLRQLMSEMKFREKPTV